MAMNPIRLARSHAGLSQGQVGFKAGVSRPYVVRAEQACYVRPGTPLEHWAAKTLSVSPNKILSDYQAYQRSHRQETLEQRGGQVMKLAAPPPVAGEANSDEAKHIVFSHQLFARWRESYWTTVTQFSIDMCVHPYSVANYEDGNMFGMPEQIYKMMVECDLIDPSFLNEKRWYYAAEAA